MKKGILLTLAAFAVSVGIVYPQEALAVDGEVTYTGTNTQLTGDDVAAGPFNLGFTFDFYGTDYTQAYVNINGTVNFGASYSRYANVPLSTAVSGTNIANNSVYAFWDDLNTNGARNIYYATVGSAPNRIFVVQWTNIYFHGTTIQMGTFQALFYEGTDVVQIQYRDLLGGNRALGDSATVGIRKDNSTYLQYSHNTAALTQEQAIRYTPNGSDGYTVNTDADYELVYLAPEGAPTSPTLVNPTNGTTGVTLTPTFEWLSVPSATSYTVLISTVSNFSSTVVNQSGITGTSYTLGSALNTSTPYYWRVQAVNSNGSSLSPTRSFTTGTLNTAPSTPTSVTSTKLVGGAESYDLSDATLSATLADPDDSEQVRYRLQIATDSDFADLVIDYRSAFAAEGVATYEFGEDTGTYLTGSATTTLGVDSYYVRLRTEDDAAASSAWYTVSGIAFSVIEAPVDNTAPGVSGISVSPEEESAEVLWTTDEAASSLVEYGPSSTYTASTTESNTVTRVTSHSVALESLRSCVTYNYRVVSRDAAGNRVQSANGQFTTKGCTGAAIVTSQTQSSAVATSTGATVSLIEGGVGLRLTVPANFSTSSAYFQLKKIDESAVIASTTAPSAKSLIGDHTYTLHAVTEGLATISEFDEPLTITVEYAAEDVIGMDPSTLRIYRWNGSVWVMLSNCSVDETEQTVTCDTDHFSTFALFGEEEETTSAGSSGTTLKGQVKNLVASGNIEKAKALIDDFPQKAKEEQLDVLVAQSSAVAPSPVVLLRDLELGLEGEDVRLLQQFLIQTNVGPAAQELARIGATGFFGMYTKNALGEYQKAQSVVPYAGYFGPITRAHMKKLELPGLWW